MALGAVVASAAWLALITLLRRWRRKSIPTAWALFLAGIGFSYVLLPLVHHLLATPPGFRYISTASNFFAFGVGLQLFALLIAGLTAVAATGGRRRLEAVWRR